MKKTDAQKKTDTLKEFASLREALVAEKEELESRIAEIAEALGSFGVTAPTPRPYRRREVGSAGTGAGPRGNPASLRSMILEVTKAAPLPRQEILAAVQKAGYKFKAKDPLNSLTTTLYTSKEIKNYGGKFGPA